MRLVIPVFFLLFLNFFQYNCPSFFLKPHYTHELLCTDSKIESIKAKSMVGVHYSFIMILLYLYTLFCFFSYKVKFNFIHDLYHTYKSVTTVVLSKIGGNYKWRSFKTNSLLHQSWTAILEAHKFHILEDLSSSHLNLYLKLGYCTCILDHHIYIHLHLMRTLCYSEKDMDSF